MNAAQFCAEHGREISSGRIAFKKTTVDKFINIYTYLNPEDFDEEMRKRLVFRMIDLYDDGIRHYINKTDQPVEKIELGNFILKIKN